MATLVEFGIELRRQANLTVGGPLYFGFPETSAAVAVPRTVSHFDEERLQYRGQLGASSAFLTPGFDDIDLLYSMQPGSKIVQSRVWGAENDTNADGNQAGFVAGVSIVVHRALMGDWEATQYELFEMLDNQADLNVRATWRALSTVNSVEDDPIISEPTRSGPVISYTCTFEARLVPE